MIEEKGLCQNKPAPTPMGLEAHFSNVFLQRSMLSEAVRLF